jgi:hypothetical protein
MHKLQFLVDDVHHKPFEQLVVQVALSWSIVAAEVRLENQLSDRQHLQIGGQLTKERQ